MCIVTSLRLDKMKRSFSQKSTYTSAYKSLSAGLTLVWKPLSEDTPLISIQKSPSSNLFVIYRSVTLELLLVLMITLLEGCTQSIYYIYITLLVLGWIVVTIIIYSLLSIASHSVSLVKTNVTRDQGLNILHYHY